MPSRDDRLARRHLSRTYQKILDVVVRIPRGRVMTYGDVALAAGLGRAARVVGYAMHALGEYVPWQRVVGRRNATTAQVSIKDAMGGALQRELLRNEGVRFSESGGIDLERYGWWPGKGSARAPKRSKPGGRSTRHR
jgi:methylated-DNA-protein-cysteine methyltransferase-like protein